MSTPYFDLENRIKANPDRLAYQIFSRITRAALSHNVEPRTLQRRVKGGESKSSRYATNTRLTRAQESYTSSRRGPTMKRLILKKSKAQDSWANETKAGSKKSTASRVPTCSDQESVVRGQSRTAKTSDMFTASQASLRSAIPRDEGIDAALPLVLDCPLAGDEEVDYNGLVVKEFPFSGRLKVELLLRLRLETATRGPVPHRQMNRQ